MPPRVVGNGKRRRQYEHIKESELKRGASKEDAERIAVATVNKIDEKKAKPQAKSLSRICLGVSQLIYCVAFEKNLYLNV